MVLVREWPLRNIHYHSLPLSELRTVKDPTLYLPPKHTAGSDSDSDFAPPKTEVYPTTNYGTDSIHTLTTNPLLYLRAQRNRTRAAHLERRVLLDAHNELPSMTPAQRAAVLAVVKENERVRRECRGIGLGSDEEDEEEEVGEFEVVEFTMTEPLRPAAPAVAQPHTMPNAQKYATFIDYVSSPTPAPILGSGDTAAPIAGGPSSTTTSTITTIIQAPSTSTTIASLPPTSAAPATLTTTAAPPPTGSATAVPAATAEMHRVITSLGQWVHAQLDTPTLFLPDSTPQSTSASTSSTTTDFDTLLKATAPAMLTPAAIVVSNTERHKITIEDNPPDVLRNLVHEPSQYHNNTNNNSDRKKPVALPPASRRTQGRRARDADENKGETKPECRKVIQHNQANQQHQRHGHAAHQAYGKWYVRPTLWNAFMQKDEAERARHSHQSTHSPPQHHRQISTLIHAKLAEIAAHRAREEQALLIYAAATTAASAQPPSTAATTVTSTDHPLGNLNGLAESRDGTRRSSGVESGMGGRDGDED
ncbi:hypothetical protein DFJ77DRAFT_253452 [Powellomyces hirtus]|nr:hypothetical protein DFJ77DRAFT_253452 [Powellomyces hirtus]